jgi:hypothetical protein
MSTSVSLWHLDADRFDRASAALAGLHPVEETTLRAVFTALGQDFATFWKQGARGWRTDLLAQDKAAVRIALRDALMSLAGTRHWTFDVGIDRAVHAIIGVQPAGLQALYRLSGGPPVRPDAGTEGVSALAAMVDAQVDQAFNVAVPERFAPEPGEAGLAGAWSSEALGRLLPLLGQVDSRETVNALLAKRERSPWGRLTGDAARASAIRKELDDGAWESWERIAEAVKATHEAGGYLGYATR